MKKGIFFLFIMLGSFFFGRVEAETPSFTIVKGLYRFTTSFDFIGKKGYEGRAVKETFSLRTVYKLFDREGEYEGEGICRALSLGAFCAWAKEIDIYDGSGKKIGFIDGKAFTTANARYDIYDANSCYAGVAYLDHGHKGFLIAGTDGKTVGYLKSKADGNACEDWELTIYKDTLDLRILKIFSSFVVDYQDKF